MSDLGKEQHKKGYMQVIDQITGIFLPIINYLTAASILKSLIVLLADYGILKRSGGIYTIFYGVSDGFFYFLPFFWRSPQPNSGKQIYSSHY